MSGILDAARRGHFDEVRRLVDCGADVNKKDLYDKTVLHFAAESGSTKMVKYLVEHGANVNSENRWNESVLNFAVEFGFFEIVKYLIARGANVNSQNDRNESALHLAVRSGFLGIVEYLVQQGAEGNCKNERKETALDYAVIGGSLEIVQYLIQHGVEVTNEDNLGDNTILFAAESGSLEVLKYSVEHGANVNYRNDRNESALHLAVQTGSMEIVKYLVEHDADVNCRNVLNDTALDYASITHSLEIVEYLIQHGADVTNEDNLGENTILFAVESASLEILKYSVEHGANVNARNDWNESALHVAVQAHSLEIVKYLVEHDADVNCKNLLNESALHYAAIIGSLEIVEYLVGHGAEVRSGDHCGENTVLFLACKQGNGLIVDYLLQHGAVHDIHKCDVRLRSPLRIACEKGDTCVAEILLKFNVDLRKEQKLFYDNDEIMDILELELESIKRREHAKISKETDDAQGPNFVALYSFKGQKSDDLSFEKGDDLTVLQSEGGYWWLAKDKDGRTGYIPANGVRHKGVLGTEVWFVGDIMRHVAEEMLLKEGQNFVALYSFNGQDSGDLSFVKGDEFTILEHAGDGWYLAKDKYGRTGYVPGNFLLQKSVLATEVAHISATARHGNQVKNERSNDFKELHHEIGGPIFVALHRFDGLDCEELSFEEGDEFTILAHAGDGWYLAKDKYGWIGYIPGNFMLQKNVLGTDVSVKDESEIPSILQYENPKSETVKASERECDGTIKRQTVALNERTNDFKELQQERELELRKSFKHRKKIQILEALEEEHLTKVGPPLKNFAEDKRFFLGSGSFGTCVYAGILEDGSEVAVKRMVIQVCEDAAENEKKILSLIETKKSPFIVSYRNFVKDNRFMYLIVDLCEETLDEHVHSQNIQHLRIHGRRMIREMLTGLKFLHDQGILHRDLKPSNILVDVDGHLKLADFGISRVLNEDETTVRTDAKGTEGWMAVEVIQTIGQVEKGRFKRKSDIQSAGMIAFFILTTGGHPFGSTKYERMTNIVAGNPVNLLTLDDPDGRQFVSRLISHRVYDRPYALEALLLPFMDE